MTEVSLEATNVAGVTRAKRAPLRAALLGVCGAGRAWLEAIAADQAYELFALGDDRIDSLELPTGARNARTFTDYRSLLVESVHPGLDLLCVTLPPFEALDFVELAADKGVAVLHHTPPARTVREARQLIERFDRARRPLAVARPWRFDPAFAPLRNLSALAGHVYAADAEVSICESAQGWRGDRTKAGGGALLHGAYDALDLLVTLLGFPERVYMQCGQALPPGAPLTYDTEDFANVTLRWPLDRVASVSARRGAHKPTWRVTLRGTKSTVEVTPTYLAVNRNDTGKNRVHRVRSQHLLAPALGALTPLLIGEPHEFDSTIRDHLATLAVIEAAYLSSRTGEPESPARFIQQS